MDFQRSPPLAKYSRSESLSEGLNCDILKISNLSDEGLIFPGIIQEKKRTKKQKKLTSLY